MGDEPLTFLLRIAGDAGQSLRGKISIAPRSAGDLAIWIDAPSCAMGMRARPCLCPLSARGRRQPDFVGAHWFQYLDEPLTGRTLDGENTHIGFVTVADLPYQGLVAAARGANTAVVRELQPRLLFPE